MSIESKALFFEFTDQRLKLSDGEENVDQKELAEEVAKWVYEIDYQFIEQRINQPLLITGVSPTGKAFNMRERAFKLILKLANLGRGELFFLFLCSFVKSSRF